MADEFGLTPECWIGASELPLGGMLRVQVLNDIADATWGAILVGAGFVAVKPRLWVRSRLEFARDVFELSAVKGASYVARCGFSLNFAPHVHSGVHRWHRTAKSVVLDLHLPLLPLHELSQGLQGADATHYRPIDQRDFTPSLLRSAKFNYELAQRRSPHDTSAAEDLFAQVTTLDQLAVAFERRRTNALGLRDFYFYTQHPIAFAFTLARLNRLAEARLELAKSSEMKLPSLARRLNEELEKASSLTGPKI